MMPRIFSVLLALLLIWSDFATQEAPSTTGVVLVSQETGQIVDVHHVDDIPAQAQAADTGDFEQIAESPAGQPGFLGGLSAQCAAVAHATHAFSEPHRRPPKV